MDIADRATLNAGECPDGDGRHVKIAPDRGLVATTTSTSIGSGGGSVSSGPVANTGGSRGNMMRLLRGGRCRCRRLTTTAALGGSLVLLSLLVVVGTLLESRLSLEGSSSSLPSSVVADARDPFSLTLSSSSSSSSSSLSSLQHSSRGETHRSQKERTSADGGVAGEDGSAAPVTTTGGADAKRRYSDDGDEGGTTAASGEAVGRGEHERHQPQHQQQKQRLVDLGSCADFRPRGGGEQREVEGYVRAVSAGGWGGGGGEGGSSGVLTSRSSASSSSSSIGGEDDGSVLDDEQQQQQQRRHGASTSTRGGRERDHRDDRCTSFDSVERYVAFFATARSGHSWISSILDASPDAMIANEFDALRFYEERRTTTGLRTTNGVPSGLTRTHPAVDHPGGRNGGQGGAGDPDSTSGVNGGEDGDWEGPSDSSPSSGGSEAVSSSNCTLRAELYGGLVANSYLCGRRGRVQYYNYTIPGLWQGRVASVVAENTTTTNRGGHDGGGGGGGPSSRPVLRVIGDKKGDRSVTRLLRRLPLGYYHHKEAAGEGDNGTDNNATRNDVAAVAATRTFFQGFLNVVGDDPRLVVVLRHPFNVVATALLRRYDRRSGSDDGGRPPPPENHHFRTKKISKILDKFRFLAWAPQNLGPSPTNWRVVRMEDLASDADREVHGLCDFVGASCPDTLVEAASERTRHSPHESWRLVNWTRGEADSINAFVRAHLSAYYDPIDVLERGEDGAGTVY